jgi:hypothetical protein
MLIRQLRVFIRIAFFILLSIAFVLVLFAPWLGLGGKYDFILYRSAGISRGDAVSWLLWLAAFYIALECLPAVYSYTRANLTTWRGIRGTANSLWANGFAAAAQLESRADGRVSPGEVRRIAILGSAFAAAAAVFILKGLWVFRTAPDLHWWQSMVDYGIDWGTPIFSFGANLLYNFGIQTPLKGQLLPIEGIAHLFPIGMRLPATVALYFIATALLFWIIGTLFGLNLFYRTLFAGLVALLLTIPVGLDYVLPFLPPLFLTHQFVLAFWWGEAPILMLLAVILFLLIGSQRSFVKNACASAGFGIGAFAAVLSYPVGAVFFVPIMALYCLGLFITSENRRELLWKAAAAALVLAIMIAARVPQFLYNLFSYAYGAYFFDLTPEGISLPANFLFLGHINDLRGLFFWLVSFAAVVVAALTGRGALRRLAIAALVCEAGIIAVTTVNLWVWQAPLAGTYAELAHAPMWASFFVLAMLLVARMLDQRAVQWASAAVSTKHPVLKLPVEHRAWLYGSVLALLIVVFWVHNQPGLRYFADYPPNAPPSIRFLERELALKPGSPFRGRLLVLVSATLDQNGQRIQEGQPLHWVSLYVNLSLKYGRPLGNDHYFDVLPFGIPMTNEYAYWTGPPTFTFDRVFFGSEGEVFGRGWFVLSRFDPRLARLAGVGMVLTDGSEVPGATPVYTERVEDSDLRIFRVEDTNAGQYSPIRPRRAETAAEAIQAIKSEGFDPETDVVTETEILADLQPATRVALTVDRGPTLIVRASSPGSSLLALPFEFSHCLRLHTEQGTAQLIPVNLQQTGLLFRGDVTAEITYRFGLFQDSRCRAEDLMRADRLHLKDALVENNRATYVHR